MTLTRFFCIAISLPLLLAACDVAPSPSKSASDEISRLQSLGYKVAARSGNNDTIVLRYSGPINASVACGQTSGKLRILKPRVVGSNGAVQDFKLNSYLILSPGSDGVISASERDGIYVISKTTRPSARASARSVETITFEPGASGTFPSGLSCRAN